MLFMCTISLFVLFEFFEFFKKFLHLFKLANPAALDMLKLNSCFTQVVIIATLTKFTNSS